MTRSKKNDKNTFSKPEPYRWVYINGEQVRVKVVDKIPNGYTFLCDWEEYALFQKSNIFMNKKEYVLFPKRTAKTNKVM